MDTEKAFREWLELWNGIQVHPLDMDRFYTFAEAYYNNSEDVPKELFCKEAKKFTKTSRKHNYGLTQKYYNRLITIVEFLKWQNREA